MSQNDEREALILKLEHAANTLQNEPVLTEDLVALLREARAALANQRAEVPQGGQCDDLRAAGWSVAVHNDYRLNGESHTFWLFTKDGVAVKGEGRTDSEALNAVRAILAAAPPSPPAEQLEAAPHQCVNHYDHCNPPQYLCDDCRMLAAAPSPPTEQQGSSEGKVVVTWNHDRSRILAVTRQDTEGRILKVIAEAPAEQPRQMVALTEDQIDAAGDAADAAVPSDPRQPRMNWEYRVAHAAIAKFCEVNGITAPGGKE